MFNKLWDAITNARFGRRNKRNARLLSTQLKKTKSQVSVVGERKHVDWNQKEAEVKAKMERQRLYEQRRASRNIVISIIAIAIFEVALFSVGMYVGRNNAPQTVREVIKTETVEDASKLEALQQKNISDIDELNKKHADELSKLKADYEGKIAELQKTQSVPVVSVVDTPYVKDNVLFYDGKSLKLPPFIANCSPVFASITQVPSSKKYTTGMYIIELHSNITDFSIDVIRNSIYRVQEIDN